MTHNLYFWCFWYRTNSEIITLKTGKTIALSHIRKEALITYISAVIKDINQWEVSISAFGHRPNDNNPGLYEFYWANEEAWIIHWPIWWFDSAMRPMNSRDGRILPRMPFPRLSARWAPEISWSPRWFNECGTEATRPSPGLQIGSRCSEFAMHLM